MKHEISKPRIGNAAFALLLIAFNVPAGYWFLTHSRTDMAFLWLGMSCFLLAVRLQPKVADEANPESADLQVSIRERWLYRALGTAGVLCFLCLILIEFRELKP